MNLLGAINYDPAGAVSKVTTSLLAMTAFDTTNLRIAFTVPSHGMVTVKITCVHHGSTTTAQVLLGCLEGATVRGRAPVTQNLLGTAIATTRTKLEASYTLTGLTPGAVNWDAAYGVEIVSSANGAIKYGGPNNTTTDDAFGGINFEIWDPQPQTTTAQLSVDSGGRVSANVTQLSGDTTAADNAESFFDGTGYAGTNNVIPTVTTATNVTTVNGLAANVITAASIATGAIDADAIADNAIDAGAIASDAITAAKIAADAGTEIASAVWDMDATGHQTQGTFGQAIGDPAADTNTIYKAVVTDATGATVGVDVVAVKAETASIQSDTNDIQSRLPAALSGDGFIKADLKSIEDELTSGNNATLNLKKLSIVNVGDDAVGIDSFGGRAIRAASDDYPALHLTSSTDEAVDIESGASYGIFVAGVSFGLYVTSITDHAVVFETGGTDKDALRLTGTGVGKSINAPQDIALPSGDLDDQLQALPTAAEVTDAVWDEATAGHTTAGTTGKALTDAGSAGDPWGTALPGAYGAGTAGKIVGDNINATVSSRSSHSAADVWSVGTRTLTSFGTLVADIWSNATRTLTAISDSAGVTTLLTRIASVLNIAGGKAEANIKQVNDTNVTGDGSGTPWGPA